MHWRHPSHHPDDTEQIRDADQRTPEVGVLRHTGATPVMRDGMVQHRPPIATEQSRKKAVHSVEAGKHEKVVASEYLHPAPRIGATVIKDAAPESVREPGRDAGSERVVTSRSDAGDQDGVLSGSHCSGKHRN
jgi:hypothetical protein